jgi:long-chain acyl-CoA synthetase
MAVVADALRRAAQTVPDKPGLIVGDRVVTYADLDRLSSAAAAALSIAGIQRGDRVALHLTNGVELVVAYFACFKSGAIALPINTRFKSAEIDYVLRHAEAAAYVGQPDLARAIVDWPEHVRVRYVDGAWIDDAAGIFDPQGGPDDDDAAAVLYTSGTTARPKGVTHTQRTLMGLAESALEEALDPNDVLFIPLPMVHMSALLATIAAVVATLPIVTAPQFDPHAFLDDWERRRGTAMAGMPVLYRALVEAQRQRPRDVTSGRLYSVGGDAVPAALQEQFSRLFGRPLTEVYGLSEVVPVTANPPGAVRTGSLGRPSPGVSVRIVDAEHRDVAHGDVGEIAVRARSVFVGYWNNPEATAQAFRDGWFLTGDLAYEDRDGFFWFAGRKKEIIVRGGSNVSPQEVEEAVYQHPAVAEVAVVGAPDERWGEIIVAAVVRREGYAVSEVELIEFARERLSLYKCPERIVFLDTMPKGPTGKVQRRTIKEMIAAGALS